MQHKKRSRLNLTEIALILICLLLLAGSWFSLNHIDEYLANLENKTKRPQLGFVLKQKNDTRLRNEGSYVWYKSREQQNIYLGDSVFSGGESQVQVQLNQGGQVTIDENSIVVFRRLNNLDIPDLGFGNFKFEVNGNVRVAIAGEVTELNGKNSQLQIVIDKNKKARFKLLTGQMTVKASDGKKTVLKPSVVSSLKQKEHDTVNYKDIQFSMTPKQIEHYWKLYDLYNTKNSLELERKPEPEMVLKTYAVSWAEASRLEQKSTSTLVQLAKNLDFNFNETFNAQKNTYAFERLHLGNNYWRVSYDNGQHWSQPQGVKVQASFMQDAAPKIQPYAENIPLLGKDITFDLDVRAPPGTIGYVAEASQTPDFLAENTRTFWKAGSGIRLSFFKTGSYYYRFRTVSKDQSLSVWSTTQKFNIYKPERPQAPSLASINGLQHYVGETVKTTWQTTGVLTEVVTFDAKNNLINKARGRKVEWTPERAGSYKIVARSFNEFGQMSPESTPVTIRVMRDPSLNVVQVKRQQRKIAADELAANVNRLNLDNLRLPTINDAYKKSHFSVQGSLWTLQSSEQASTGADRAIAGGIGLRGLYWAGRTGFEGLLKSQIFSGSTATESSISSAEGRLHYRFTTRLPISFLPQMQISAFGGIEAYKNSSSLFNSQYELMKFGTSLAFPLASNWTTGGEFVYGASTDSSSKYEVSGFISRFLSKDWSFGVGYRLTFFEAGSTDSSPTATLPYREGYTEGYSALYYHF